MATTTASNLEKQAHPVPEILVGAARYRGWERTRPPLSRRFERTLTFVEFIADFAAVFAATMISLSLSGWWGLDLRVSAPSQFTVGLGIGILFVLLLDREGAYRRGNGLLRVKETEQVLRAASQTGLLVFATTVWVGPKHSLWLILAGLLIVCVVVITEKQLVYGAVRKLHELGWGVRKVIIYGAGSTGRLVFGALARSPKLGLDPVAFVDDNPSVGRVYAPSYRRERSAPVRPGPLTKELVQELDASMVVLAIPSFSREKFLQALGETTSAGVKFAFVPGHYVSSEFWTEHTDIDGQLLATFSGPAERHLYAFSKRALDLVVSLALLALCFPLWLVLAILIRLDSPGPVLVVQKRVGKDGRLFDLFKFRTMYTEAPVYSYSPLTSQDPRITRVGRFLRRTSLDELPQLINVLRGEMSLVGPRPEMPFIVERYLPKHRLRLHVKPGLTGLWQISADRALWIHENIEYDLYYIRNRSFFMDVAILLHTLLFAMRGI